MSYGFRSWSPDTNLISDPLTMGCVCLGSVYVNRDVSQTLSFPTVAAGDLRIFFLGETCHEVYYVTVNGVAGLQFVPGQVRNDYAGGTRVLVFARNTIGESQYAFLSVSEAGERLVSALHPVPQFIGRVQFGPAQAGNQVLVGDTTVRKRVYTASTSAGAGRNRFIMWSLPSVSGSYWYQGSSFIPSSSSTATISQTVVSPTNVVPPLAEAFIFAIDGIPASGDAYGFRVWDQSGGLTFDAGHKHMQAKASYTGIQIPVNNGPQQYDYYMPEMSSTPLLMLPTMYFESYTRIGTTQSRTRRVWEGFCHRSGQTFSTVRYQTAQTVDDGATSESYTYGSTTNNSTFVVDGNIYY